MVSDYLIVRADDENSANKRLLIPIDRALDGRVPPNVAEASSQT